MVVYEWLTEKGPFAGPDVVAYGDQHETPPPPPLREPVPELPAAVEAVVMGALAKDWRQRDGRRNACAQAFEQAAKPVQAQPAAASPRVRPQPAEALQAAAGTPGTLLHVLQGHAARLWK